MTWLREAGVLLLLLAALLVGGLFVAVLGPGYLAWAVFRRLHPPPR